MLAGVELTIGAKQKDDWRRSSVLVRNESTRGAGADQLTHDRHSALSVLHCRGRSAVIWPARPEEHWWRGPWAKARYVSRVVQDHTLITAFIERKWNLPRDDLP